MRRHICFWLFTCLVLLGISNAAVCQFGDPVPLYPQEMDGMVHVVNRALILSETDIAVPGRGLGLGFTRHYNSDGVHRYISGASYMGWRWSHAYQWEINIGSESTHNVHYYKPVVAVVTGGGAKQVFTGPSTKNHTDWRSPTTVLTPKSGVHATLKLEQSGTTWAYVYITRGGIRYKFERIIDNPGSIVVGIDVLAEISDPNGNRLKLHYEKVPEAPEFSYPRLVAVEDTLGRILKFHYDIQIDGVSRPRIISKIEYGLGTSQALTTVYQTVNYSYSYYREGIYSWDTKYYTCLTSVAHQLETGDPRGTALTTSYDYDTYRNDPHQILFSKGYLAAVVSPLGYRTEVGSHNNGEVSTVRVRDVPPDDNTDGDVLYTRKYINRTSGTSAYTVGNPDTGSSRKHYYDYTVTSGHVVLFGYVTKQNEGYYSHSHWTYWSRKVHRASHNRSAYDDYDFDYKISYAGSNADHNYQMGNPTKWEQYETINVGRSTQTSTLLRKWEADYETTFNRPIWQIDPMGHKTTFSYDTNGNLTEQRSKANTGTQPHAIAHDIVTTHAYDSYGNRIKTTFMPGTTQEKVVETVYDSTHSTYPIEVKTTVTKDGKDHLIKTKSEWDTDRGLKTADIDAEGRRTEYAYWKDRKLKYTRRVADDLYTV